jgi:hypothetical protein
VKPQRSESIAVETLGPHLPLADVPGAATQLLQTGHSRIAGRLFEGRAAAWRTLLTYAHFGLSTDVGAHFGRRLQQTASRKPGLNRPLKKSALDRICGA